MKKNKDIKPLNTLFVTSFLIFVSSFIVVIILYVIKIVIMLYVL